MRIRLKVWVENDDGASAIGDGRLAILQAVARTGSLSAAARELGMSYRSLWGKVRSLEQALGLSLVVGQAGGVGHGGARLTPAGQRLVVAYERFSRASHEFCERQGELLLAELAALRCRPERPGR